MFCRKCGAPLRGGDKFCSQCGTPVKIPPEYEYNDENNQFSDGTLSESLPEDIPVRRVPLDSGEDPELSDEDPEPTENYGLPDHDFERSYRHYGRCGPDTGRYEPSPGMKDSIFTDGPGNGYEDGSEDGPDGWSSSVPLYDERLYRDSIVDRPEKKSHALRTTVIALVLVALASIFLLFLYLFAENGFKMPAFLPGGSSAGSGADGTGNSSGIVIMTEAQQPDSAASQQPDSAATQQPDSAASQQPDSVATQQPGSTAEPQGEPLQTELPQIETQQTETPAPETAAAAALGKIDPAQFDVLLQQNGFTGNAAGIYVYDLKENTEYAGGGADHPMYASGCLTVPILYTAANLLDQGAIALNDQITYTNSIGGRGEADPSYRERQSYDLSFYLTTMLTYSDNNCMNCLLDYLTLDQINRICQGAGFASVNLQRKLVAEVTDGAENYVSARDLGLMVKELYNGKFRTLGRDFMTKYFRISPDDANATLIGRAQSIPADAVFLNQDGKGDTRVSEVALVSTDSASYVISILLTGDYGFTYEDAVLSISDYVYQSLSKQEETT